MSDAFDRVASALGHRYRRGVLVRLLDHNPLKTAETELVDAANTPTPLDSTDPEQVQIELYHSHLPRLEEYGYIDWNQDAGTVVKGSEWAEIEPVLLLLDEHAGALPIDWP